MDLAGLLQHVGSSRRDLETRTRGGSRSGWDGRLANRRLVFFVTVRSMHETERSFSKLPEVGRFPLDDLLRRRFDQRRLSRPIGRRGPRRKGGALSRLRRRFRGLATSRATALRWNPVGERTALNKQRGREEPHGPA